MNQTHQHLIMKVRNLKVQVWGTMLLMLNSTWDEEYTISLTSLRKLVLYLNLNTDQ